MRFTSDGPNIPDLLLERRDAGRVVFLCGAGVSLNSGLPTFYILTKRVVDFFDPSAESDIMVAFQPWIDGAKGALTPLDQIFHLLQREYGREEVNALVAKILRESTVGHNVGHDHRTVSRISSDQAGQPQVVTTNFDTLFEGLGEKGTARYYVPPALPDIDRHVPVSGITYLHGRLEEGEPTANPYVLSSSDFGRAYLSEGWATSFVRSLLKTYTVVLVGYKAEDPPVKYLLQGLNHDGMSDRSNLYAFDKGTHEEVEAKWRDRGVTAIAFSDYPVLWKNLEAWATRADNHRAWKRGVAEMAQNSPTSLEAYQRGQIAHLVRTSPGAKLFANTKPSPHPEWICVFDASCRAAHSSRGIGPDAVEYDPLLVYGLDDDPDRPSKADRTARSTHDNILDWRRGDTNPADGHALGSRQILGQEALPTRLYHLINWIGKNLDSPVIAWWAARKNGLHPRLSERLHWHLRRGDCPNDMGRRVWNLILEYQADERNRAGDDGWFDFEGKLKKEGWSPIMRREFQSLTAPILTRGRSYGVTANKPPVEDWDELLLIRIAPLKITFADKRSVEITIPDNELSTALLTLTENIKRAAGMLNDIDTTYFKSPTCYPERAVDGEDHDCETHAMAQWPLSLFKRMIDLDPSTARGFAMSWPLEDRFFFRKLKLFALNHAALFTATEAFEKVVSLSQDAFWDTEGVRELLFLVSDRWSEFNEEQRLALGDRFLAGPDQMAHQSDEKYPSLRDGFAARCTRWLTMQGNVLSREQQAKLDGLIKYMPNWSDGWAISMVMERGMNVYRVGTDESPDVILDLPVNQVVERAVADLKRDFDSRTEKRPFTGLVKVNPRKALSALTVRAKQSDFQQAFWSSLITDWPDGTSLRLQRQRLRRISALPVQVLQGLGHTLGQWLEQKLSSLLAVDEDLAWHAFDSVMTAVLATDSAATNSAHEEATVDGKAIPRSRRTHDDAIGSPVGTLTKALLREFKRRAPQAGDGIPADILSRIERLLTASGEGRDHAVAIITFELSWLEHVSPDWVAERAVPWFAFEHRVSEPAWNGLLSSSKIPTAPVRLALHDHLLALFPHIYDYQWNRDLAKVAAQWIAWMAIFASGEDAGVTGRDARTVLRKMSDTTRCEVIYWLGLVGKKNDDGWAELVIPFINDIWPRERVFKTSASVRSWVSMLASQGENFPTLLKEVKKFLATVEGETHWLYRFTKKIGGDEPLTVRYPSDVLDLMSAIVPSSPKDIPVDLGEILQIIEDTDPSLTQDLRFFHLSGLVDRQ